IRIAGALAEVHRRGVIHRDLKPENILIHPTTGEVKLDGLGIAILTPRKEPGLTSPALIEGTLPYISPEQTGRTNPAIDERCDLYSVAVPFSELLTGRLPFSARDPLEWVYSHVARTPATIGEPVPEMLAKIVGRLLVKMPDDRYQSALGLRHDLERCLAGWT